LLKRAAFFIFALYNLYYEKVLSSDKKTEHGTWAFDEKRNGQDKSNALGIATAMKIVD